MVQTQSLRAYQADGIEAARKLIIAGHRCILLQLPTGGGKSSVASAMIAGAISKGKRVLFVGHRRELISQPFWRLTAYGVPEEKIGVIMGNGVITKPDGTPYLARRPYAPVQIATVQTLSRRPLPPADLVFLDEAHHAQARTHKAIIEHYSKAVVIGLTATPVRADGKGLGDLFEVLHCISSFRELADMGYLAIPRVYTEPSPDLKGVRTTAGDYNLGQLETAVSRQKLVASIVETWLKHAGGRRTVVFACTVKHSLSIVERFVAAGVRAEHLDGETPTDTRDAILARLDRGETQVVSNVGVLTEGWDCPSVKCVVMARPTKSLGLALQMMGRGLRPWEGVEPILLDHGGNIERHGFPQDEREWSLEDGKKQKGEGEAPSKECPQCHQRIPTPCLVCPLCGFEYPLPEEAAGELVEARPEAEIVAAWSVKERREWYEEQLADGARRGYKLGWARHRYHEKVGKWPSFYEVELKYYPKSDETTYETTARYAE